MRTIIRLSVFCCAALLASGGALAQDEGESPPVFESVDWWIHRNLFGDPGEGVGLVFPDDFVPFDPATQLAHELDVLVAEAVISDPDFVGEGDDEVFLAQNSFWIPVPGYRAPEPGPIVTDTEGFIPEDGEGFSPPEGQDQFTYLFVIPIPEFQGKNQARLRGLVDYDVRWQIVFFASNDQDPEDRRPLNNCAAPFVHCELIDAIENPALAPPNPQPFADAGADMVVEAGSTVRLDGRLTFDSFNVGFDVNSRNVFEKDAITYTWEWISGPERVEPIYPDLDTQPWLAEVTLNDLGTYVYRLTADDNVNALPTQDEVIVEVVSAIPENQAPVARARGPGGPVTVGTVITLNGTASFDPDGDPLTYIWQQTDEIGGQIPADDIGRFFQPLAGVDSPISRWQAVTPGTYHFRLLVNDGEFVSADRVSVTIIEAATAGIVVNAGLVEDERAGDADQPGPEATPNQVAAPCGLGVLPAALVPLLGLPIRPRRRG